MSRMTVGCYLMSCEEDEVTPVVSESSIRLSNKGKNEFSLVCLVSLKTGLIAVMRSGFLMGKVSKLQTH